MYIINEYQTTGGVTAIVTPQTEVNRDEAFRKFYLACAAASVSSVECHTVKVERHDGFVEDVKVFRHDVVTEEE